ncbi:radical SAM protein [Bacillus sp. ILBB4]|nr:radical SAM protein [Bacillus sp. ILBB4]
MTHTLCFMGVNRDTVTAGPGKRLEFFTKGCIRGVIAPCQGCFNESTWTFEGLSRELTVDEVVEICDETAWNRQVTFCGGEPILQARSLAAVAKRLKERDSSFHFVMYTAYKLDTLMKYGLKFTWVKEKHGQAMYNALKEYSSHIEYVGESIEIPSVYGEEPEFYTTKAHFTILTPDDVQEVMKHIDLIVDGDYQQEKRLTTSEYMHDGWFIGSSNQRVIHGPLSVYKNKLIYTPAAEYNRWLSHIEKCKCCGHELFLEDAPFCDITCSKRYKKRQREMASIGGA